MLLVITGIELEQFRRACGSYTAIMKSVILVLAFATLGSGSTLRDKRSYGHAQAYPVSVHTVVQPSSTLPVYEYPESTQIDTHARTVYSVSVPITHTVHLEQPSHSRQIFYHSQPSYQPVQSYQPVYQSYQAPVYTPSVYSPTVYRSRSYAPSHPYVYRRNLAWC